MSVASGAFRLLSFLSFCLDIIILLNLVLSSAIAFREYREELLG